MSFRGVSDAYRAIDAAINEKALCYYDLLNMLCGYHSFAYLK